MALPRPASPRALLADLRAFAQQRSRVQWIAAIVAVMMPVVIIWTFIKDGNTNIAPGEQLIYVESWSADRSDAQIKIDQARRQKDREAAQAERQRQFQELGRKFGIE